MGHLSEWEAHRRDAWPEAEDLGIAARKYQRHEEKYMETHEQHKGKEVQRGGSHPVPPAHKAYENTPLVEEGIDGAAAAKGELHGRVASPKGRSEKSEE